MDHNFAPGYLFNQLPSHVSDTSSYPLRNAESHTQVHARTALYGNSFLLSTIREWNKLPIDHRNVETLNNFKTVVTEGNIEISHYFFYEIVQKKICTPDLEWHAAHKTITYTDIT